MTTNTTSFAKSVSKSTVKLVVAVALTMAVMFTSGVSDNLFDTAITSQAHAGCIGGGGGSGGGC